jgi:hypothetical protein
MASEKGEAKQTTAASIEPPREAGMRHSSLDLTIYVYTDPTLLDVAGALGSLPDLAMDAGAKADVEQAAQ